MVHPVKAKVEINRNKPWIRWSFHIFATFWERPRDNWPELLGASPKAIQSFEQGWRNIPLSAERQVLLLMALKSSQNKNARPCWVIRRCSEESRQQCPAWEFQAGHLCWFINGTICEGEARESWNEKMGICRRCVVFVHLFSPTETGGFPRPPGEEPAVA